MTQAYVTSGSNLINTKFQSQRKEKRGTDTGHTLLHYFKIFLFSLNKEQNKAAPKPTTTSNMKKILERHNLHSKNLEKLEQPSLELQLVEDSTCSRLNKEVAEKSHQLRQMRGEDLRGLNIDELLQLEKSLEAGLSCVIEKKGMQLMEENERLKQQVVEITNGRKQVTADSENVGYEEGQSSESVTNVCNSNGPLHDYESSDTSLKLGFAAPRVQNLETFVRNMWNWEVAGFEPRPVEAEQPIVRRYSISTTRENSEFSKLALASKVHRLKDKIKLAKEDYLELRQEASDLQEYSNAKLDRVTRYLGVLAEKTRKLDQVALETEARISPLINEKKRLFNDLLTAKGSIKVFCRVRPLFEDESPSVVEFPDDCTIRVNTGSDTISNPKKDFEFDRVYGPHVGQAELFTDVQPYVQSALDGYNEGSSYDRGLYARCFEELFDLANSDSTSTSRFNFSVTVFELYNEQITDLLSEPESTLQKICMGSLESFIELQQEKVDNPLDFSRILKAAFQRRENNISKLNVSHLIVTVHIYYNNVISGENLYSKLSLVDLAGSEGLIAEDDSSERVTDMLHVMKSLSALGDVLSSLTSRKDVVPYENSMLTKVLADSLGRDSKTLMILNVCPNIANLSETLSSLSFCSRARNATLSLGNRDTIKKWRDVANDARKELYEKEKEIQDLKQEVLELTQALKDANDQCVLLFNEVQKAWKVSFTLQSDLKSENIMIADKHKVEKEQNAQLRNQVAQLLQTEQDQKMIMQQKDSTIQTLQAQIKSMESQLNEALHLREARSTFGSESGPVISSISKATGDGMDSSAVTKKLEEELKKRDALIERLHEENEKLFDRLTEKASLAGSPQVSSPLSKGTVNVKSQELGRNENNKGRSMDVVPSPLGADKTDGTVALVKSGSEKVKSTPAGEYLTAALNDFDPEQYDSLAAISDGANKLLMLVLAAVIKAGASREHEILAEIRDAVFAFIRKMEPKRVMDTMLVSRVRILYIRSLLARSPELQSIKVPPVECFLERANTGRSRSSSRGNSPGRSPVHFVEEQIQGFKVNIKLEKKSKLSSVVLRMRGIDQDAWRQQVTGGKLREIQEEAKSFAIGNKALAALFVHTPAGELQRQIRSWLAENFEFLSVTGDDASGGITGQLELLSTAIMDGWMAGLGAALPPSTDALGQLLSEYAKRVFTSQLQHLKDIAGTLATEDAEDAAQVAKLRSALESVDHKRRKILQQMRSDAALLTLEDGGLPVQNPSTAAEDARLASLISLDGILKQVKDILRQSSVNTLSKSKKKSLLVSLDELGERMPSLLNIDHPCAQRQIAEARRLVESIPEQDDPLHELTHARKSTADLGSGTETDVAQWNVLQFNTGSTTPFIIKCGANSNSELVIKADARVQEPKGGEIMRVVPRPSVLENMSMDEMKHVFSQLPEALSLLALARTADGTRARYSRLYRTLAMKVPSLRDLVGELEKGGVLKDLSFKLSVSHSSSSASSPSNQLSPAGPESFYYDDGGGSSDSVANYTRASMPPHLLKSLYEELSGIHPSFERLILMVIDGLPAEFVLGKDGQPPREDFREAMPYTQALLSNGMATGYHAKAAPPTVTMPRLKAMVSGAIGGFLDVAFNFNTQSMSDDNLLGQFFRIGWKMVMLGDETWLKLFPGLFTRHDGVSSFYVKDTVQVDQNVSRHLENELNRDDWNLLILHYLGLDHVGHIGGRNSILMAPKLKEMDEVVKMIHLSTIQTRDNDQGKTLLVVVSDHGMTENGNHGGSSYEETDSLALFVGLKNDLSDYAVSSCNSIYQVDIAPTLALLFGVPIPKNNVGVLISEAFDLLTDDKQLRVLELNSWQLLRLIQAQLPGLSCRNLPSHDGFTDGLASTIVECSGSMEKMLCCLYMNAINLHSFLEVEVTLQVSKSRDDYSCTVAAYHQFLKTASEWLSRRVTDKPVGLLAFGIVAMAISSLTLLGLMICMSTEDQPGENQRLCNSITGLHKWSVNEIFLLGVMLILVMSMASSSMVEEEQYIWHFVLSTSYVLFLRKAVQPLAPGSAKNFFKLMKGQTERLDFRISSIILLLISGRILRGWHQGGVNWTYLPDISKWLEQSGVNHVRSIQLASGLLVISLSIFALFLFGSRRKITQLVGFCFLICGFLVLWHLYHNNAFVSASYDAAIQAQIIYAILGIATIGTFAALPWFIPFWFPGTCSKPNVKSTLVTFDGQCIFSLVEFRDSSYLIGLAYIICWCLLQLLLQQPINSMPILLLLVQILSSMLYFSCSGLQHIEVEVALLYYMGMAGHFALGNSNTLATIDVAGAFIGLSSHSMFLSGILMFIITYASPMLFLLSMLMYISVKSTSYLANHQNVDSGHLAKMILGFPCLVPVGLNSILLTSYTIVLLLMRNHLFVWSVFSPKYLYVCATTVCIYVGVFVVAATEIYTCWVLALRRKKQISIR
ncbi:Kinesin-like protein KIN-14A [Populus alba x Populus x berolinensis]|nr:Kinesin-like protein KIN-14A [Populus alba x Populus x berolinensis]